VLALKWIQKYVASFGGSPSLATLAGLSAEAASIQNHVLSLMSEGF